METLVLSQRGYSHRSEQLECFMSRQERFRLRNFHSGLPSQARVDGDFPIIEHYSRVTIYLGSEYATPLYTAGVEIDFRMFNLSRILMKSKDFIGPNVNELD